MFNAIVWGWERECLLWGGWAMNRLYVMDVREIAYPSGMLRDRFAPRDDRKGGGFLFSYLRICYATSFCAMTGVLGAIKTKSFFRCVLICHVNVCL